jgi:hypothetical protein
LALSCRGDFFAPAGFPGGLPRFLTAPAVRFDGLLVRGDLDRVALQRQIIEVAGT